MPITNGKLGRLCKNCDKRFIPSGKCSKVCDDCKVKSIKDSTKKSIMTRKRMHSEKRRAKKREKTEFLERYNNMPLWNKIVRCRACRQLYGTMIKDDSNRFCPECYWIDRADREDLG